MLGIITSGASASDIIIQLFAMLFAIIIAITFHEWAHGFIAYKNGDMTAKFMGRLTLNPIKHFDPFGFLMLAVVGFGWAKPVPIDSNNFKNARRGILTTSLAGVVMNLILAFLFAGLLAIEYAIIEAVGLNHDNNFTFYVARLFQYFFLYGIVINLTLMAFNILSIYPLDGFHVVESFTKYDNKYCVFMRRYGMYVLFGFLILSSILGRINPYLDIFGLYIGVIRDGIMKLMSIIFGISI